jgi:hypothetical protein
MGTVTKITNLWIWVRSKIFILGLLSGTHSLRGAEADTPLTLPSKAERIVRLHSFLVIIII